MTNNSTPHADDALKVDKGIKPIHIQQFVLKRCAEPIQIGDKIVWNLNNHEVNMKALEARVPELYHDKFIIPYQASGVWGYMVFILPERMLEAETLAYSRDNGEYIPFPSYYKHSSKETNEAVKKDIDDIIERWY